MAKHDHLIKDAALDYAANFNPLDHKRLMEIAAKSSANDPKVMRLPHPARSRYMETMAVSRSMWKSDWPALQKAIADPTIPTPKLIRYCFETSRAFSSTYNYSLYNSQGTNGGDISSQLLAMRFQLNHGTMFQTTDELDEQLANTDISDDIPMATVRPPFPMCYFEFGETRSSKLQIYNAQSGWHTAEGCYLFEYHDIIEPLADRGPIRFLEMVVTGSPKDNVGDDAIQFFSIPITDEEISIRDTLDLYFKLHTEEIEQAKAQDSNSPLRAVGRSEFNVVHDCVLHVLKILLYLSTEDKSATKLNEYSDIRAELERLKSGSKRAKAERKIERAYDRIMLGPKHAATPSGPAADDSGRDHKHRAIHWRRGHFRQQVHGEGRALRKTIWIRPTLVKGDALDTPGEPQTKTYKIR